MSKYLLLMIFSCGGCSLFFSGSNDDKDGVASDGGASDDTGNESTGGDTNGSATNCVIQSSEDQPPIDDCIDFAAMASIGLLDYTFVPNTGACATPVPNDGGALAIALFQTDTACIRRAWKDTEFSLNGRSMSVDFEKHFGNTQLNATMGFAYKKNGIELESNWQKAISKSALVR